MKKILVCLFLMFFLSQYSFALDLTGIGYGKSEKEAKKNALADLSSLIRVEVKTKFFKKFTKIGSKYTKDIKNLILTESDLPILGVQYNMYAAKSELMAKAHLNPDNVKKIYKDELDTTHNNIYKSLELLKKTKSDDEKYQILSNLLTLIDSYAKYKAVGILIDIDNIKTLPVTETEVKAKLLSLEKSVNSINIGARALIKDLKYDKIYIFPPTTLNSQEITPFASVLKDKMSEYLKNNRSPKNANYYYKGSYIINKNSIDVTYRLIDSYGKVILTKVVNFNKKAYKNYRVIPQTVDFDKLLHQGVVISNKLRVNVATNKGSRNLIFKEKQVIKILIKMNRPGYFYIVGHVNKKQEKYSYLLELNEGMGNRKFIQRISADDVNKWISLGEFEVVKPFGVESLQVMASNKDLINSVPNNKYDNKAELYKISNNPKKAVIKTRALRRKKSKKTLIAETALTFTTMKR